MLNVVKKLLLLQDLLTGKLLFDDSRVCKMFIRICLIQIMCFITPKTVITFDTHITRVLIESIALCNDNDISCLISKPHEIH